MGNGTGDFTGNFIRLSKAGVTKVLIYNNGDIEVTDPTAGIILKDRTTGSRYRLYVDNGTLAIEPA